MTHYSRLSKIVVDVPAADHDRELAFWSAAVGQPLTRFDAHPEYHGAPLHGTEFGLLIQRLGDGPGRVHLDIHTDDLAAEVARLEELGAERVQQTLASRGRRHSPGREPWRPPLPSRRSPPRLRPEGLRST